MNADPPLKEFADHTDSVLWVVTKGRILTYVSPAFESIWRRPVEAVLGSLEAFLEAVHPEDRPGFLRWIEEAERDGIRTAMEYRILRPDGEERWIRTRAFPVPAGSEEEFRFAGFSDDITEHRFRQDELERAHLQMARTFESLHEAVFIVDPDSRTIQESNPAATRIFGYAREELVGSPTLMLHTSPEAHAEFGTASRAALEDGRTYQTEHTMLRKDGTTFESEHTVTSLDRNRGIEGGVVSVVRDISGQKELERRLYEAQRLESVGRLAGGVAHDFNNLLTIIRSNVELLAEETLVENPSFQLLEEIREASKRGADMTGQLLAFGRRQALEPRPMELRDILLAMERILRRLMGEDVRVTLELPEGETTAEVDQARLEHAILNMAMNARQAMPEGGRLSLVLRREETLPPADRKRFPEAAMGPHVLLEIADTGRGMDRATLSRIFEPFFTTRAREGGTGLGLPSVYGMVTQTGGAMAVESTPGVGTTFVLLFPASARAPRRAAPASPVDPEPRGGGETLLVVEDDGAVRRAVSRMLERVGYRVVATGSAEEALERLAAESAGISLCITDLVLSGMSGLHLVQVLKENHPEMSVLLISGYSEERLAMDADRIGETPYLSKPFSAGELTAKVRTILDAKGRSVAESLTGGRGAGDREDFPAAEP